MQPDGRTVMGREASSPGPPGRARTRWPRSAWEYSPKSWRTYPGTGKAGRLGGRRRDFQRLLSLSYQPHNTVRSLALANVSMFLSKHVSVPVCHHERYVSEPTV